MLYQPEKQKPSVWPKILIMGLKLMAVMTALGTMYWVVGYLLSVVSQIIFGHQINMSRITITSIVATICTPIFALVSIFIHYKISSKISALFDIFAPILIVVIWAIILFT